MSDENTAAATKRYEVLRLLGVGGMGKVYLARDRLLGREVAIKTLTEGLGANPKAQARFRREASIQASFEHPHLLRLLDVLLDRPPYSLVMEVIEGADLEHHLRGGPMPVEEVERLVREVASALITLHERGVVHRDLKPANVMRRGRDGSFVVMDLGLVLDADLTRLTATGAIIGTPLYLPPEVIQGAEWTSAGDQFQLAAIVFRCLTGRRHLEADSLQEMADRVLAGDFASFTSEDPVPAATRAVIRRGLAMDPTARWADVEAFASALRDAGITPPSGAAASGPTASSGGGPGSRSWRRAMVLGSVLLLAGATRFLFPNPPPRPATEPGPVAESPPDLMAAEALMDALRAELEEAKTWVWGSHGVPAAVDTQRRATTSRRLFLDPDPDLWDQQLRFLPALRGELQRLSTLPPGAPLDPDLRDDLEDLDERYRREIPIRPLAAALGLVAPPPAAPPAPGLVKLLETGHLSPLPAKLPAGLAAVCAALEEARFAVEQAKARFDANPDHPMRSASVILSRSLSFEEMARELCQSRAGRIKLAESLEEGARTLRRAFLLAGRCRREHPEFEEELALTIAMTVETLIPLTPHSIPDEALLGGDVDTPAAALMVGAYRLTRERLLKVAATRAEIESVPRTRALLRRAMEASSTPMGRRRRELARQFLAIAHERSQDLEALGALAREALLEPDPEDRLNLARLAGMVADIEVAYPGRQGLTRSQLEETVKILRERVDMFPAGQGGKYSDRLTALQEFLEGQ